MAPGVEIRMPSLPTTKSLKRPPMGKIRSWSAGLGAKLSGGSTSDKQDVAHQVELRKKGIDALYTSTEAYWSYLGKKKPIPFDAALIPLDETASITSTDKAASQKPDGKMLPVEALGLAMASFASAYAEGSNYAACLAMLGEAHIQLANLQSAFTKDTSHIFLARIARSKAALDSFTAALKKLDSATARLDSAQAKVQKSKKEKRELEEELRLAKAAYDEAMTDVEARGEAIQEAEYDDWQCLTTYMQAQLDYMGQAHAVLEQVKSMWGDAPAASGLRSGTSTPLTRPRSLSGPGHKPRPSISRRSSAKEGLENSAPVSRFGSRSSLSLPNSERPASASDETKKEKDKKNRLRMPSLSGAGDAVASVASGIGSLGRTSLFGTPAGEPSPDKDRESSKWNFMSRSKKDAGFTTMDESSRTCDADARPPALPAREQARPSISPLDVHLGDHDASPDLHLSRASSRSSVASSIGNHRRHNDTSPFSPNTDDHEPAFLSAAQRRRSAHDTIHERGESQLSSEMHPMPVDNYLGASVHAVGLNHTGLSAYSDAGDPFASAMSPQATGDRFTEDETETDEEEERTGLTSGNPNGASGGGWRAGGGASVRGPPPPIPSSASFLSKSKARLAPPPPPLPSRNSN